MSDLGKIVRNIDKISTNEILALLIQVDKDLDLKTEIAFPLQHTKMFILGKYLGATNKPKCEKIIDITLNKLHRFLISKNRQARKEILRAISHLSENENEGYKAFVKNLS
jgi:hypothetical protein